MNDLIRILQEREDISFEEAQYYLKKSAGNIDRAVYLIHRKRNSLFYRSIERIRNGFSSFWIYRIVICREDRMFINIPLFVFLGLLIVVNISRIDLFFFLFLLMLTIIFSGAEFTVAKAESGLTQKSYTEPEWKKTTVHTEKNEAVKPINIEKGNVANMQVPINREERKEELNDYSEIIIK